jgi:hypothetical protein
MLLVLAYWSTEFACLFWSIKIIRTLIYYRYIDA